MLNLNLEETPNTPSVRFDVDNSRLDIEGRLLPEHPGPFFEELREWLEAAEQQCPSCTISFYLYYYNTTSTKRIVMFLEEIKRKNDAGMSVQVEWRYDEEDEDAHDDAQDFIKASGLDIKLIALADEDE